MIPLNFDRLEAAGSFAPPRPRYRGFIRGLLFAVPIAAALIWALFVVLP